MLRDGVTVGEAYRLGYTAGREEGRRLFAPAGRPGLPPEVWKDVLKLVHPDRWQGSPLEETARRVTAWVLEHRL